MEAERSEIQKHVSKEYSCKNCGKSFQSKFRFTIHERIHTGVKPYVCVICKKAFIRKDKLNEHKRIHTGEKPYSCELCKKAYSSNSKLLKHNRTLAHISMCDVKSVTMNSSFDLNNFVDYSLAKHKSIHTSEKPYSCEMCIKSFSRNSHLLRHNKTSGHLNKSKIVNPNVNNYVVCGEAIKVEIIKEEINEEESVDDPLSLQQN